MIIFNKVVLPAPFGPVRPYLLPELNEMVTSSNKIRLPKLLEMRFNIIMNDKKGVKILRESYDV